MTWPWQRPRRVWVREFWEGYEDVTVTVHRTEKSAKDLTQEQRTGKVVRGNVGLSEVVDLEWRPESPGIARSPGEQTARIGHSRAVAVYSTEVLP